MKKIAYLVVCATLLFVGSSRAADAPFVELKGHTSEISVGRFDSDRNGIAFASDGKKIVTTGADNL